jgi:hypothetical protein
MRHYLLESCVLLLPFSLARDTLAERSGIRGEQMQILRGRTQTWLIVN